MFHRTHRSRLLITVLGTTVLGTTVLGTATDAPAQGYSPADRAFLEGSSSTSYPLGRFNARVQQLHGDLPAGAHLSGHAYRRDATLLRGTVPAFEVELEVSMSISPREPGRPSRTFANNRGPSPTVVLPRTVLSFPATERPTEDPGRPELIIPYSQPFPMPPAGGTLCLETVVYGNLTAKGPDRNFQVYQDAHQLFSDGRTVQPGYRFGEGCSAAGASGPGYASFELTRLGPTMSLEISARNGVPDDGSGMARSYLMVSAEPFSGPLPLRTDCILGTAVEWFGVLGPNDANGRWDGILPVIHIPPAYERFYLQVGSAHLGTGALALGDISTIVVPPPGPPVIPASRIASGSDRDAATGTVSLAVPVTLFF